MIAYLIRRLVFMVGLLVVISITAFVIIQIPPGDWLTTYIARLQAAGQAIDEAQIASLTKQYGLNLPLHSQYFKWVGGMFRGNFGISFSYNRPVWELLMERVPLTIIISMFALLITYMIAVPIGIYSATNQYTLPDYAFTVLGFVGLAIPNFLLALILMFLFYKYFGLSVGGLFSSQFMGEPWSWAKFANMLGHLPVPLLVISLAGTAGLIRVMRGCLLDELRKAYVVTARAKGVGERKLLYKYPVRIAINPIISTVGWTLPAIFSGETITAIVLNLPTTGPLLYQSLLSQDMYLAGSIIMMLTFLTVVGTFISDILLAVVDPRIRIG